VHLPWSSRSLMTTSVDRIVAARGLPTPRAFRPWRSSHLRRFMPRPTLRVYFTPQPLPGFTLQGISLPHSHDASSTPLCLHGGSPDLAARSCRVHRSASRRLQGFTPCGSPLSGPWGLALALPAPFLSFPSSRFRSLSQPHTRACFRSSPYCPSVKSSTQPAYNVFRARSLTGLSQGLPTCSRF